MSARLRRARWGLGSGAEVLHRSDPFVGAGIVAAYSGLIVVAELAGVVGYAIGGAILDAALMTVLLGHYVWGERAPHRKLFPVLALIALLRVLSITAAVPRLPMVTWYITVGGALLIGELLTIRLVEEPWERLNLTIRRWRVDLAIAAFGVPAGLVGYLLLRPGLLMTDAGPAQVLAGMIGIVVFGAFVEALLFRGLLQSVAIETFGDERIGLVYAAAMSGVMYLGSGSLPYTIAVGAYALLLGAVILRGGSLWGAAASHGVALVGMAFVWPIVLAAA